MKKLIINQKNLPRVKHSDSSIRIRINKTQLPHETPSLKKSPSSQLQDIDLCLQIFQKANGKLSEIDEDKINLTVQLLRCFKETLINNQQLMTQSLRFSKLKFKTIGDLQQKENNPCSFTSDKNNKQIPQSERLQHSMQKLFNAPKTPKNKRLFSTSKKNNNQKSNEEEHQVLSISQQQPLLKQADQYLPEIHQLKLSDDKQFPSMVHSFHQDSIDQQAKKILKLQQDLRLIRIQVDQKNQEIKQLNDRIEQLNLNIQNLVRKNSQKSEEYNKLFEDYSHVVQKSTQIYRLEDQLSQSKQIYEKLKEQSKQKYANLQEDYKELKKVRQEAENNWRRIEKEKNEKIEQQLGRYETAQQFYELSRRDLKQQNENLIDLLEEREREILHLYQVLHCPKQYIQQNSKQQMKQIGPVVEVQ